MIDEYIYIMDSKLYAYNEIQRGSPITNIFNTLARDLKHLKKRGKIYVTFDIGHSSFREGEQSYYKGHRRAAFLKKPKAEQEAHKKFNEDYLKLVGLFKLLDVTVIAVEGVEADDLMSLIALKHPKASVVLLTADRDHLHSVVGTENVTMYSGREGKTFDHNYVVEEYGTETRRKFTVLKALLGDDGDNLKSFRNLGPVKSKQLLAELSDYDNDALIVEQAEAFLEDRPNIKIHEFHLEEGRDTTAKVFESNMKVGATFVDYTYMTEKQVKEYEECLIAPRLEGEFEQECIKALGYPVFLSMDARRIYNVT